jgi:hypothetical protein
MITLHITPAMIGAGTKALHRQAKADPDVAVLAIFVAMIEARTDTPRIEVAQAATNDNRPHRPR